MGANIKRLLRLYAQYAKMDFNWFTQDTFMCGVCIFSDLLSNIASISGVFLLSVRFAGVGNMTADEVLFMLGFFTMADGLTFMFAGFNIDNISRRIGRGQLDHMLIQPLPMWMGLMTEGFIPVSGNAGFLCGLVLMIVSMVRIGMAVTFGWLLLLLLCVAIHMGVKYGSNFLIGSAAFYRPAAFEEISSLSNGLFSTLGKYPLAGLPAWVVGILTTVLPVGLMAWLPSLVLLHKAEAFSALALPITAVACLLALARYAFQKGMRHYVQNGCNRYREIGHRN